jgi:hypothetical protein
MLWSHHIVPTFLPSQQTAINELVAATHVSLQAFAVIATQPIFGATGERKWVPADCLVSLELPSQRSDLSRVLDCQPPIQVKRAAIFGTFYQVDGGPIEYKRSVQGLLGASVRLNTVTWDRDQTLLMETVCLHLYGFILVMLFGNYMAGDGQRLIVSVLCYHASAQEWDAKDLKMKYLNYRLPGPTYTEKTVEQFTTSFHQITAKFKKYKDVDETTAAVDDRAPEQPLKKTAALTIEQRGHIRPTENIVKKVVGWVGFFSVLSFRIKIVLKSR